MGDDSLVQLSAEGQGKGKDGGSMNDAGYSWMAQNHTVFLVGWGHDQASNTNYWIIRNSYGPKWGEKGDFKIRRGQNDFAIEEDIVALDPVLCSAASEEGCFVV
jgi:cathepsin C